MFCCCSLFRSIDLFLEKRFSIDTGRPRNGRRRRSDQSNDEKSASSSAEEKCGLSTKTNEGGGVIKSASRNNEKSDIPTSVGGNDTNDEENSRRKGRSERQSNNTEKRPQFTELKVSAENIDEVREEPDAFDTSTRLSSKISTDSMRRIRSIGGSKAEGAGDSDNRVSFALGKRKTNRYVSLHQKSFMKNPFANSFALPRANPTKKLDERHNESMLSLQSKDDDGEKYKSDNIQMMKILTSMSMILTKKSLVKAVMSHQPMYQQTPFQLFFLLSMNVKAAKKQLESCPLDDGRNFLDPFNCKLADCVDRYPSKLGKDALEPTELSAFCCPEGIKVRLIPRAGVAGAKHMGWMGKRACQYKLLVVSIFR